MTYFTIVPGNGADLNIYREGSTYLTVKRVCWFMRVSGYIHADTEEVTTYTVDLSLFRNKYQLWVPTEPAVHIHPRGRIIRVGNQLMKIRKRDFRSFPKEIFVDGKMMALLSWQWRERLYSLQLTLPNVLDEKLLLFSILHIPYRVAGSLDT